MAPSHSPVVPRSPLDESHDLPDVDLEAVTTWEQALQTFPCPRCQEDPYGTPGLREAGHSMRDGATYLPCSVCQPTWVLDNFRGSRHGAAATYEAERMSAGARPVRYRWNWISSYPKQVAIFDRATGEQVWTGREGSTGFSAQRELDRLDAEWFAALEGAPKR